MRRGGIPRDASLSGGPRVRVEASHGYDAMDQRIATADDWAIRARSEVFAVAGAYFVMDSVLKFAGQGGVARLLDRGISAFLDPGYGNNPAFYQQHPGALDWYRDTYR